MQIAKDIFYFIGSIMGILAFSRGLMIPVLERYQDNWSKIKDTISEEEIIYLEHELSHSMSIERDRLNKLSRLVEDINEGSEYLIFGPIYESKFEEKKKRIKNLYYELRQYIQVPFWEPKTASSGGNEKTYWQLNKDYFYKQDEGDTEFIDYPTHLRESAEIIEKIRIEYRALGVLASLHPIELLRPDYFVNKRSKIPRQMNNDE